MIDLVNLITQISGIVALLWTAYQEYRHSQAKLSIQNAISGYIDDPEEVKKAISK